MLTELAGDAVGIGDGERAAGFAEGRPDDVTDWLVEVCRCLAAGAREGVSISDGAVETSS